MEPTTPVYSRAAVTQILEMVKDPEVPVLSISDMGIIKDVNLDGEAVTVQIMPTYSGCPAMDVISEDIQTILTLHGYKDFKIETVLSPAWSSDFISESGRQKLREYGIAPPEKGAGKAGLMHIAEIACPQCGSHKTEVVSEFGSTACKALYKCSDCLEPFDYFKCV